MTDTIQKEILPVEDFVFKGLKQRMNEVFGVPVAFDNSTDEIQAMRKMQQDGVKYPFMFLTVTSFARTVEGWRSTPFIRRGVDAFISTDNKMAYKVSMIPVDFICEVTYKDNEFSRVKEYAKRWLMSIQSGFLKFSIEYGQLHLPIHIVLGDDVPTPKREANAENIQEYSVITQLTVKGWMSEEKLREQQAVTEIQVEAYFQELNEQPNTKTFVFPQTK